GLRLHLGVNGDEVIARRLERGISLSDPFLHRRFRFFEIGQPLLDLRIELAEALRLPGDARLGDRWGDVGAEAAGVNVRRWFVCSRLWLLAFRLPPVLSDRGTGKEDGDNTDYHARAKCSPALRQRRRWHLSASRMGAILDCAACARLTSVSSNRCLSRH